MRETGRAWKAELLKMRHSGCYPMHIAGAVLPAVVFLRVIKLECDIAGFGIF